MARYGLLGIGVHLVWPTDAWGGTNERTEDFDRLRSMGYALVVSSAVVIVLGRRSRLRDRAART